MTDFAGICLDMFTDIVAVHWGSHPITKLDFVGNKYVVRGKSKKIEDIIDQPTWRISTGLDLRGRDPRDGVSPSLIYPPRAAGLKNNGTPTSDNPGALNETLFGDGILVYEMDLYDRRGAKRAADPGVEDDNYFADLRYPPETKPIAIDGYVLQELSYCEGNSQAGSDPGSRKRALGVGIGLEYRAVKQVYLAPPIYNDDGSIADPGGQPLNNPFVFRSSNTLNTFTTLDALNVYAPCAPGYYDPSPGMGRMIGGAPIAFGRLRIAIERKASRISVCINGAGPYGAAPKYTIPRAPDVPKLNSRPAYFNPDNWATSLSGCAVLRCLWLYRPDQQLPTDPATGTPKTLAQLSEVHDLPAPDSDSWYEVK